MRGTGVSSAVMKLIKVLVMMDSNSLPKDLRISRLQPNALNLTSHLCIYYFVVCDTFHAFIITSSIIIVPPR